MSGRPFNARAVPYTWDKGKPAARQGIALITRNNGVARAFIPTRDDAEQLVNQLIALLENPHTWETTND